MPRKPAFALRRCVPETDAVKLLAASIFPPFDFQRVIVDPWSTDATMSLWIVLLGFFIGTAAGLLGNFLLLRRMALVGDAISHSVLPGVVLAYVVLGSIHSAAMLAGAAVFGVLAVLLIEFLQRRARVKTDAATGVAFTTLFALGLVLIRRFADRAHIDADCALFGRMEIVLLETLRTPFGDLPETVCIMGLVAAVAALLIGAFYKELLLTSFDPALATTLGFRSGLIHYLLMSLASVVIVAALQAVGAVLVVGMMVLPPALARLCADRLPALLVLTVGFSLVGALAGLHLGVWWGAPLAASMIVALGVLFVAIWSAVWLRRKFS